MNLYICKQDNVPHLYVENFDISAYCLQNHVPHLPPFYVQFMKFYATFVVKCLYPVLVQQDEWYEYLYLYCSRSLLPHTPPFSKLQVPVGTTSTGVRQPVKSNLQYVVLVPVLRELRSTLSFSRSLSVPLQFGARQRYCSYQQSISEVEREGVQARDRHRKQAQYYQVRVPPNTRFLLTGT